MESGSGLTPCDPDSVAFDPFRRVSALQTACFVGLNSPRTHRCRRFTVTLAGNGARLAENVDRLFLRFEGLPPSVIYQLAWRTLNDTYNLNIGRKFANLPALKQRLAATNDRYLEQQSELLDSTIDAGALATLAEPHDDRVIRLLDSLLYTGGLLGNWTTRELHDRVLARHRLSEQDYTLGQLRYDLSKLRAHSLAERVGTSRRYRLTADGVRLGALLFKIRTRLLGPIFATPSHTPSPRSEHPSTVEAALRTVDHALDNFPRDPRPHCRLTCQRSKPATIPTPATSCAYSLHKILSPARLDS